jgi:hypothetical protein
VAKRKTHLAKVVSAEKAAVPQHAPPPPPDAFGKAFPPNPDHQLPTTSLHDLFAQQARQMLDRTDLDEEQKMNVLVAMSCPCCGAGGMSFTAKIKRRP